MTETYRERIKHGRQAADAYLQRKPAKHRAEMRMIQRALPLLGNCHSILDAPCGVGRATIMLAAQGYRCTGMDLGAGALEVAREQARGVASAARFEAGDIEKMPYTARQFDALLCFRLYHHFPDEATRERVIAELCRVADRHVLLSYLSPLALTSIRRTLKERLFGEVSTQYATSLDSIRRKFAGHGFGLVADIARLPVLHTLHLAVFVRNE